LSSATEKEKIRMKSGFFPSPQYYPFYLSKKGRKTKIYISAV